MPLLGDLAFFVRLLASPRTRGGALRWWRARRSDFLLSAALPWIAFPAIDFLESRSLRGARVFEYGSGGSTLFWLRQGAAHVVSIEHDRAWFDAMRKRVTGVDLRLVPPESANTTADRADPAAYASDDPAFAKHRFRAYVQQIDTFPDASLDVVLVDGRARPSCVVHAAPKVKPGGLLILDNADRGYYLEKSSAALQEFSRRTFEGPTPGTAALSTTAIFTRER
jgi:hypothetical protein